MDFVSGFLSPSVGRCLVKICGIRRLADAERCAALGADAIGLNLWPKSKRYVDPEALRGWLARCPTGLARIGVFVNASDDEMLPWLESGLLHAAQLHGDESPAACAGLFDAGYRVLKAIGVRDRDSLSSLPDYEGKVDGIVLDAFCPGDYGGSGKRFDWELALEAKALVPTCPIILSGGLTPENVALAVAQVHPFAVDVASGVELSPGEKDFDAVKNFLAAVH